MRREFLGDSYDIVKRFWAESLQPVGKLFAHPKFIAGELRSAYTAMTRIPILGSEPELETPFGVLLDPDTGIPLPSEAVRAASLKYAPLPYIVDEIGRLKSAYLICFDQSFHRDSDRSKEMQRELKRQALAESRLASFYYVSHAPFLFVASNDEALLTVRSRLVECGVPECRFET